MLLLWCYDSSSLGWKGAGVLARRVFFSFHYDADITRAQRVRNSWVTQRWTREEKVARGFFDAGLWESAKTQGRTAIERLIDQGLVNTSVTAVLIGAETYSRDYVMYEIRESDLLPEN